MRTTWLQNKILWCTVPAAVLMLLVSCEEPQRVDSTPGGWGQQAVQSDWTSNRGNGTARGYRAPGSSPTFTTGVPDLSGKNSGLGGSPAGGVSSAPPGSIKFERSGGQPHQNSSDDWFGGFFDGWFD